MHDKCRDVDIVSMEKQPVKPVFTEGETMIIFDIDIWYWSKPIHVFFLYNKI